MPHLLVVDDDRLSRQIISDILAKRGHRTVAVENATRALEEAGRQTFDLVLTDLVMPGVDGLALASQLRERDPSQEIILISSRDDAKASTAALRAGASDYLTKPIDEAELVIAVDRCIERSMLRKERLRLLDENVEFSRFQAVSKLCLELLSNPDLEWLQERILADFSGVCDAQSAALWVSDERGQLVLKVYRGLIDRQFLRERIDPNLPASGPLREGIPFITGEAPRPVLHVPLKAQGELLGVAQLFDPLSGEFRGDLLKSAKLLGDFAALALKNGRRFFSLQRLGLRDRDTAAYNLSYFTDYASKEIYKARRYGRTFSLLTFSVDNLNQIRQRLGHDESRKATRGLIRALSHIIRDSDILAKATEQEFYLLLAETDYFGALMFMRRALAAVKDDPDTKDIEAKLPLGLVGGAATFPKDGEDLDELVLRARRRLDERRASLQRRLHLDGVSFWEEVEILLGGAQSPKLPTDEKAEPSRRGKVAQTLFDELQAEVGRELTRDPYSRGLLYVGGAEVKADMPIAQGLDALPADFAFRVYALGRRADLDSHPALTPVFLEGDERMLRHQFLLWLSEHSAYALIQRPGRGVTWGFHTSDTAVVESLITKLQAEYDLQPY